MISSKHFILFLTAPEVLDEGGLMSSALYPEYAFFWYRICWMCYVLLRKCLVWKRRRLKFKSLPERINSEFFHFDIEAL